MTLNLTTQVLQKRVFNQPILDLHIKDFMLGQTKNYLHPDKNTLDIGAATGMYSSFFAQYSKHVYSFEAVPPVYKELQKIEFLYDNVTTFNKAVGEEIGEFDFWVDDKRLSNSGFQNLVGGQKITVDAVNVDSLDIDNIGFIKIDVEGNEVDVLNGAVKTIEKYRPVCMVEIYARFNKYPVETSFQFFFDKNYKCYYNEKGNGLKPVNNMEDALKAIKIPEITDGDFLFVPN